MKWIIEGKFTNEWEEVDEVTEEDGGEAEAQRLLGEYRLAHHPAPHRLRTVD